MQMKHHVRIYDLTMVKKGTVIFLGTQSYNVNHLACFHLYLDATWLTMGTPIFSISFPLELLHKMSPCPQTLHKVHSKISFPQFLYDNDPYKN